MELASGHRGLRMGGVWRAGRPGSRMGVLGEDCTPRCGAGGPGPREDGAGGCSAGVAVGPEPSLPLSCSQSPELTRFLLLPPRAGPELGRPSPGVEGGGGDVAATALAGRPAGLWEAWRGDSSECGAERNGAQLFPEAPGGPCVASRARRRQASTPTC